MRTDWSHSSGLIDYEENLQYAWNVESGVYGAVKRYEPDGNVDGSFCLISESYGVPENFFTDRSWDQEEDVKGVHSRNGELTIWMWKTTEMN